MCGIVGAVAQRDVIPILLEGLRRLEYRGYDSAGIAVLDSAGDDGIRTDRIAGKVAELADSLARKPLSGMTGIAHTRWATHGSPSVDNAHPHVCRDEVAIVHNGIIENHNRIRCLQQANGYQFCSQTDSEVVVNEIHRHLSAGADPLQSVFNTVKVLEGAYALGIIFRGQPDRLIAARNGSPLVIGIGIGEYFIASDILALLPVTRKFIYLEDGDLVDIHLRGGVRILAQDGREVQRPVITSASGYDVVDKSGYRHYMLKEIYSQPAAIAETLEGRIASGKVLDEAFGPGAAKVLDRARAVQIVACGTSYHAGLVAKYWFESVAGIPCFVDIASEYRYRDSVVIPESLFICISQSGETADTLAALKLAGTRDYLATLSICNAPESSMVRESDLVFLTRAGQEIGVASTKAFTTQLTGLLLLVLLFARRSRNNARLEQEILALLEELPARINQVLELDEHISSVSERFVNKYHALYLARGSMLPIAMEGALKLKEISYIHAEAYAAGELKHGPLALVDKDMPVIAVAPNNNLFRKLDSNLQEVRARGGELYVFADADVGMESLDNTHKIVIPPVNNYIAPIVYTVPLQLFAYHVAVLKGADVDQPRNLAKSVTVE